MKKLTITLLIVLMTVGCQSVPPIANQTPHSSGQVVTSDQVEFWFTSHQIKPPQLNDEHYVLITPGQLHTLVEETNRLRIFYNLQWTGELTDCDNFARLFQAVAPFVLRRDIIVDADLLIFVVIVQQDVPWGGIEAGGNHAIVGVMTTEGAYLIEPQVGTYVTLKNYPNPIIDIRDQ